MEKRKLTIMKAEKKFDQGSGLEGTLEVERYQAEFIFLHWKRVRKSAWRMAWDWTNSGKIPGPLPGVILDVCQKADQQYEFARRQYVEARLELLKSKSNPN